MAAPTHNLYTPIDKPDGGTIWHKIGVTWAGKKPNTYQLEFNSLPLPNSNGKVLVQMFENKPKLTDSTNPKNLDFPEDEVPF